MVVGSGYKNIGSLILKMDYICQCQESKITRPIRVYQPGKPETTD